MLQQYRMTIAALVCSVLVGCGGSSDTAAPAGSAEVVPAQAPSASVVVTPAPAPSAPVVVTPEPTPSALVVVTPVPVPSAPAVVAPPVPAPVPVALTPSSPPAATFAYGFTTLRVEQYSGGEPATAGGSDFRNPCGYSHMATDDPIVFPGRPGASHLHAFFGNTSTNASSTTETLRVAGSSTCAGGIANLSAYWVPAMIDTATNKAIVPASNLIYYKGGYNDIPRSVMIAPPAGLRVVAGNASSNDKELTGSTSPGDWTLHHSFECYPAGYSTRTQRVPDCAPGGFILSMLEFPNCWDGINLDSPDHRSHMAYSGGGTCPASHPVALPVVSLNVHYDVLAGQDTKKWRLASDAYDTSKPGGYSMHGDVWYNWQPDMAEAWMNGCIRGLKDCHAQLLGDGRILY